MAHEETHSHPRTPPWRTGCIAEPRADRNRLLRALPDEEYDLLLPHMERLEVPLLAVLNAPSTSCSPRRCCRRCSAFAAPA